jgi:hypothetical protein
VSGRGGLKKLAQPDVEGGRQPLEGFQRRELLPALDLPDVGEVHRPDPTAEGALREPLPLTESPKTASDLLSQHPGGGGHEWRRINILSIDMRRLIIYPLS